MAQPPNLAPDIRSSVEDIDPTLIFEESGEKVMALDVARSFMHDQGALWWAPEFGYNLWSLLGTNLDQDAVQNAVEINCLRDERVESVEVKAVLSEDRQILTLDIQLKPVNSTATVTLALAIGDVGRVLRQIVTIT